MCAQVSYSARRSEDYFQNSFLFCFGIQGFDLRHQACEVAGTFFLSSLSGLRFLFLCEYMCVCVCALGSVRGVGYLKLEFQTVESCLPTVGAGN